LQQVYRSGNQEGPGLLQDGTLPPQYYERAGTIPGQQAFGTNAQNNAANARQQDTRLAQQGSEFATRQQGINDRYQQGQAGIDRRYNQTRNDVLEQQQLAQEAMASQPAPPAASPLELFKSNYGRNPRVGYGPSADGTQEVLLEGSPEQATAYQRVRDFEAAEKYFQDAMAQVLNTGEGGGAYSNTPEAIALSQRGKTDLGPAYSSRMNTGAWTLGDEETVEGTYAMNLQDAAGRLLNLFDQNIGAAGDWNEEAFQKLRSGRDVFRDSARMAYEAAGLEPPQYAPDKATSYRDWVARPKRPDLR
jgi:hypothetical protein